MGDIRDWTTPIALLRVLQADGGSATASSAIVCSLSPSPAPTASAPAEIATSPAFRRPGDPAKVGAARWLIFWRWCSTARTPEAFSRRFGRRGAARSADVRECHLVAGSSTTMLKGGAPVRDFPPEYRKFWAEVLVTIPGVR